MARRRCRSSAISRQTGVGSAGEDKKRRPPPTLESRVAKKIYDNLKALNPAQIDCVKCPNGLTCRDRVREDLQRLDNGEDITMGALYYRELINIYAGESATLKALLKEPPQLPVSAEAMKVSNALNRSHPDRTVLVAYMSTVLEINGTELAGIYRALWVLKPSVKKLLPVCMAGLDFIRRLRLVDKFTRQTHVMKGWISMVLEASLRVSRNSREPDSDWVTIHREYLELVCDASDISAVLGREGKWNAIAQDF